MCVALPADRRNLPGSMTWEPLWCQPVPCPVPSVGVEGPREESPCGNLPLGSPSSIPQPAAGAAGDKWVAGWKQARLWTGRAKPASLSLCRTASLPASRPPCHRTALPAEPLPVSGISERSERREDGDAASCCCNSLGTCFSVTRLRQARWWRLRSMAHTPGAAVQMSTCCGTETALPSSRHVVGPAVMNLRTSWPGWFWPSRSCCVRRKGGEE